MRGYILRDSCSAAVGIRQCRKAPSCMTEKPGNFGRFPLLSRLHRRRSGEEAATVKSVARLGLGRPPQVERERFCDR